MRKIFKDHLNPPVELVSIGCRRQLQRIVASRNGSLSTYYGRPNILTELNLLYHSKCGYCECKINVAATENIEHYRPKAGVNEVDLLPGSIHLGYYWLGNEWTNLLVACPKCNQNGHKGTRFPIRNHINRINNHPAYLPIGTVDFALNHFGISPLSDEDPLILNPERCNPDLHFGIKKTGEILIKRNSPYAKATRDVCHLDRDPLIVARKSIIDEIVVDLCNLIVIRYDIIAPLSDLQYGSLLFNIFKKILARIDEKAEYTMVGRNMIKHFETLVVGDGRIAEVYRADIIRHFLDWLV